MTTNLQRLKILLQQAEEGATMANMSMGFPNDRIEIKSVHFGGDDRGHEGDVIHPTEYVRNITALYRNSWILSPLREAIAIVEANEVLIERIQRLESMVRDARIDEIHYLNAAGRTK